MDIFLVISLTILLVLSICDAIFAIRNLIYQKKWDEEKDNIIRNDPAVTAAELCAKYVDFCVRNNCLVEY
jgi:hypothetical protein